MELLITGIISGVVVGLIVYLAGKSKTTELSERNRSIEEQKENLQLRLDDESKRANEAEKQLAELNADYRNLKERLTEQKVEFEKLREKFETEFENLANKILDEKSKKFTEQNKEKLDQVLKPLGEKIEQFKKQVADTYEKETRDRVSLKEQIVKMAELNQKMTDEAKNLTKALKGDTKKQGNWGEVILQRILERSGLRKDHEYEIQQSHTTEEGKRLQPDVVIRLPEEKRLIVDSKVSLTAYERYVSADDDNIREKALKAHVQSVWSHVKGLSAKNYQQIYDANSPDFVLLFIPVEPAFAAALQGDSDLYYEAFENNIVIVSPSTLLATLATIDNIWKQEYQNKNAMEIAKRGGALYDKFKLFVESMQDIGQRIEQTQKSYDEAMGRLTTGNGNVLRQVEMLRSLGAKVSKQLPEELLQNDEIEKES